MKMFINLGPCIGLFNYYFIIEWKQFYFIFIRHKDY